MIVDIYDELLLNTKQAIKRCVDEEGGHVEILSGLDGEPSSEWPTFVSHGRVYYSTHLNVIANAVSVSGIDFDNGNMAAMTLADFGFRKICLFADILGLDMDYIIETGNINQQLPNNPTTMINVDPTGNIGTAGVTGVSYQVDGSQFIPNNPASYAHGTIDTAQPEFKGYSAYINNKAFDTKVEYEKPKSFFHKVWK